MDALPAKKTIRTYGKRTHRVIGRPLQEVQDDAVFRQLAEANVKLELPKPPEAISKEEDRRDVYASRRKDSRRHQRERESPKVQRRGRRARQQASAEPDEHCEKENDGADIARDAEESLTCAPADSEALSHTSPPQKVTRVPASVAERKARATGQPQPVPPSAPTSGGLHDRLPTTPSSDVSLVERKLEAMSLATPNRISRPSSPMETPPARVPMTAPSPLSAASTAGSLFVRMETAAFSMSTPTSLKSSSLTGKLSPALDLELSPIRSVAATSDCERDDLKYDNASDRIETATLMSYEAESPVCVATSDMPHTVSADSKSVLAIKSRIAACTDVLDLLDDAPTMPRRQSALPESLKVERERQSSQDSGGETLVSDRAYLEAPEEPTTDGLSALLDLASQKTPVSFDDFFAGSRVDAKIGEATYSSVFSMTYAYRPSTPAALKIIPFRTATDADGEGEGEDIMPADDVVKELWVTERVGRMEGFVELFGVGVCKGPWPQWLVEIWDAWQEPSENMHPTDMPPDQLYALVVLPNQGKDLEHSTSFTMPQCQSILRQLVCALAAAEESMEFEHRDLHWGNVLVRNVASHNDEELLVSWTVDGKECRVPHCGLRMCIIDYTWSRVRQGQEVTFNPLEDPCLFTGLGKGKRGGDLQFDVYRWIKAETDGRWEEFFPKTNIFWIHYLIDKILTKRMAPIPRSTSKKAREATKSEQKAMTEVCARALHYGSCREMLKRELLAAGRWLSLPDSPNVDGLANELKQLNI
ncbi:Serine/threonine-protein kinase haspin [Geranomyces variabilis]|uniref:non-specific serine/threonine protein kinase n=1 Tax=Geranomyces variabilis TaxID=109894 RepID=A0AAD5TFJ3_9FUNG|nr:Serine/threonine-protein kinase haspin [Geranomyces variabilis]